MDTIKENVVISAPHIKVGIYAVCTESPDHPGDDFDVQKRCVKHTGHSRQFKNAYG